MRELTKSVLSYAWSTSLFGVQQMVHLFTPQGWQQPGPAAQSFEKITKATAEEMGGLVKSAFKLGNNLQRTGVDVAFSVFTLGMFDGDHSGAPSGSSRTGSAAGVQQSGDFLTQSLQAVGQTAGVIGQAVGGIFCGQGCGGSRSEPTGWGPVPPPSQG